MKKTIISLFFLIIIFVALQHGVLDILGTDAFHYAVYALFALVVFCALYFVGIKNPENTPQLPADLPTKEDKSDEE